MQNQTAQLSKTECKTKLYKQAKHHAEPNCTNKQKNTQNHTIQIGSHYAEPNCTHTQNNMQNRPAQIRNTIHRAKLYRYARQQAEPNCTKE